MRPSVAKIEKLGVMPGDITDESVVKEWEEAVCSIECPVTDEEAVVLLNALPQVESSCYGLAWTLLHACETAPGFSRTLVEQSRVTGEWKNTLLTGLRNAG